MTAKEPFTVASAARELGFGLGYTYSLIYAGRLRASKVDGKWRIPAEEIEALLAKRGARQ